MMVMSIIVDALKFLYHLAENAGGQLSGLQEPDTCTYILFESMSLLGKNCQSIMFPLETLSHYFIQVSNGSDFIV